MFTSFETASLAGVVTPEPVDPLAPLAGGGLPAERAEVYRSLLLKSLRTQPYLLPPPERLVLAQMRLELGADVSHSELQMAADQYFADFHRENNKVSGPNPMAYLGRLKAHEMAAIAGDQQVPALAGNPEVLTVMINFTGVETYTTDDAVAVHTNCLTDTAVFSPGFQVVIDGPQFNEIAQPANNYKAWLDPATSPTGGFTREYFELLMYSTTGDTSLMRPELPNPWDGGYGYDFSGVSFRNYFSENSRGLYNLQGEVVEVSVPEAVSYFGAALCNGNWFDDNFNNRPAYTIAISTAQQINTLYPGASTATNGDFRWADYDIEDVFDYDNDGNFNEPDGYVDHFFLIQAGQHDGGINGLFQIWPYSGDVNTTAFGAGPGGNQIGGYRVAVDAAHPLGSVWIMNYTVSDEVGGLGVLVHEYLHDLGLPDNYALYDGQANTGFWDIMSDGVFGGGLTGMLPIHVSISDKEFLGWNVPTEIDLAGIADLGAADGADFTIGQQSKPPAGTIDGLRINLPDQIIPAPVAPFGSYMWWSDKSGDRSDSIARHFTLQAGETATITAQLAYFLEQDYDYFYWEISSTVTGGWIPLEVFSGTTQLTTDDNTYSTNPTGNGISGVSPDSTWLQATATITPGAHAGGQVGLRFRYATDPQIQGDGVFLDNISITGSATGLIFLDDVEGGDHWSQMREGVNRTKSWSIFAGIWRDSHYYLVEWRNAGEPPGANGTSNVASAMEIAGFDAGLNRMYWGSSYDEDGWAIKFVPFSMHTPGMLVWYINRHYENNLGSSLFDPPSIGAKGHIRVVDPNPYPFLVEDEVGTFTTGGVWSSFDGAYTLIDRSPFTLELDILNTGTPSVTHIPGAQAKPVFHDRIGVAPGLIGEFPDNAFFYDADGGVVLPTVNGVLYRPAWDFYKHTGNPGLEAFGVNLEVVDLASDGTWGKVRFWLDDDTIFFDKRANLTTAAFGQVITYTLTLKDASGTRYADEFNYTYAATMTDTLPAGTAYVPGSLSLIDGPWTTNPGTVAITGDTIVWAGTLGGNPLDVPDAKIQYAVKVGATSKALASSATLKVEQILITTDTFNESLTTPYLWPKQRLYIATSQVGLAGQLYLPSIYD
jgi:immune inhibitor A